MGWGKVSSSVSRRPKLRLTGRQVVTPELVADVLCGPFSVLLAGVPTRSIMGTRNESRESGGGCVPKKSASRILEDSDSFFFS